MILKGSTVASIGHARNWAAHLFKNENEKIIVEQTIDGGQGRESVEQSLVAMQLYTKMTKGKTGIFHVAISPREHEELTPQQYDRAIEIIEKRLNLEGQQRARVDHVKEGRAHAHCFWSTVDQENEKLIPLPHYKRNLQTCSKQMTKEFNLEPVRRVANENTIEVSNSDRMRQGEGKHKKCTDRKREISDIWNNTKDSNEFVEQVRAAGYEVAKGERSRFVLIDQDGKPYNLARELPKLVKAKDVRERLGDIELSNVADASKELAERLAQEQSYDREQESIERINKELEGADKAAKEKFQIEQERAAKERKAQQSRGRKRLPFPANDTGKPSPSTPTPEKKSLKPLTAKEDLGEGNKKDKEKTPVQLARAQSEKWDKYTEWSRDANSRILSLKAKFSKEHKLDLKEQDIKDLEKELAKYDTTLGRLTGQFDKVKGQLDKQKTDLSNLVYQMQQQTEKLERELAKSKPPDITPESANTNEPPVKKVEKDSPVIDFEDAAKKKESERLSAKDAFKDKMRKQEQERQERERGKEKGLDYDI